MTHARTTIRNTVKVAVTGLTTTGSNVFGPEKRNFTDDELPCLSVYTTSEGVDEDLGLSVGALHRDLTLIIEARAKATGDIDATLDLINEEVEVALFSISNLVVNIIGTEKDFDASSEKPVGLATMNYNVKYFTRDGTPGVLLFQP